MINFRFSRQLHPIFDAAASAMVEEKQIVFGRVDCDREQALCKEFAVNKVFFFRNICAVWSLEKSQNHYESLTSDHNPASKKF